MYKIEGIFRLQFNVAGKYDALKNSQKMSRCEHNHLAHYKHFCLYCKFKFYYPEILRVVGGADTPKILLLNLNWACRYLLHNNYKLFCFYYKFTFYYPVILRGYWYSKNKATKSQLSLSELTGNYYTTVRNFFVFTTN